MQRSESRVHSRKDIEEKKVNIHTRELCRFLLTYFPEGIAIFTNIDLVVNQFDDRAQLPSDGVV